MDYSNPLIVQSDRTLLLDVHAPRAEECRNALIPFAELERSPEHLHTYRLTPLSLWNANAAGFSPDDAVQVLHDFARYDVPQAVEVWIKETAGRFGKLRLVPAPWIEIPDTKNKGFIKEEYLYLVTESLPVFKEISASLVGRKYLTCCEYEKPQDELMNQTVVSEEEKAHCFRLSLTERGTIKQELLKMGWPIKDDVPLFEGEPLEINLRKKTLS
ncbi:MAG: helicase-associated domain-containing protein, partial [Treponema sp.]|nr:helicase-associated domain-containing protein [Treponema sp.]